MTRCYEFYAMVLKNPEFCDKSDSTISRITTYIEFMQKQGIQFDRSPTDKARFIQLQIHAGVTEHAVTQPTSIVQEESIDSVPLIAETPKIQSPKVEEPVEKCLVCETKPISLHECELCRLSTSLAIEVDGHFYCSEQHAERAKRSGLFKPQPKPEVREWKPKETWTQRQAVMHPQKSAFELSVIQDLQAEGLPIETDREFCVQKTIPDGYVASKNIVIYLDGPVHEGKEERDIQLRERLEKFYGCHVVSVKFVTDTLEERERAKTEIREMLK